MTTHATPKQLEPGRELDALVAEQVMGSIRAGAYENGEPYYSPHHSDSGLTLDVISPAPDYSTDIAVAWTVVEKVMHLKVSDDTIQPAFQVMASSYDDVYYAGWCSLGSNTYHWKCAPTAPHAICLAALAATGAKE